MITSLSQFEITSQKDLDTFIEKLHPEDWTNREINKISPKLLEKQDIYFINNVNKDAWKGATTSHLRAVKDTLDPGIIYQNNQFMYFELRESKLYDKLKNMENKLDDKLKNMENKLDDKLKNMENKIDDKLKNMETKLEELHKENVEIKKEIVTIKERLDKNEDFAEETRRMNGIIFEETIRSSIKEKYGTSYSKCYMINTVSNLASYINEIMSIELNSFCAENKIYINAKTICKKMGLKDTIEDLEIFLSYFGIKVSVMQINFGGSLRILITDQSEVSLIYEVGECKLTLSQESKKSAIYQLDRIISVIRKIIFNEYRGIFNRFYGRGNVFYLCKKKDVKSDKINNEFVSYDFIEFPYSLNGK